MGRPNKFDGMLHEFCVKLGWCGSLKDGKQLQVSDFIPETGSVSADEFVRWLIVAEGLPPETDASRLKQLKAVFVKHMGADVISAEALRSGHRSV